MRKRNCAKTIVTAVLACSLCGGMITAYAGSDNPSAERQTAGGYGTERAEVSGNAADVPYESPKPSREDSEGGLVELHNPILDQETGDVTFSYIDFGNYPQGEVTGSALTGEIVNAEYVNGDAVVDGIKYRRVSVPNQVVTEPAVTGSAMTEPVVTGEAVSGQNRYFKYEPIRWRLVHTQGGQAVLRTDKILAYKIYDGTYEETGRYSDNWTGTTLQYWLNCYDNQEDGFLQTAFSEQEENSIKL